MSQCGSRWNENHKFVSDVLTNNTVMKICKKILFNKHDSTRAYDFYQKKR